MPRLIVIQGADEGRQFDLSGPLVGIGRDTKSGVRLHDTEVSRHHAELRQVDGGYHIADVGSANGTFVNGQPVEETFLRAGDRIAVGQTLLVYRAGRAATAHDDLVEQVTLINRPEPGIDVPSAIIRTISDAEGSRILARPEQAGTAWLRTALANLGVMYEAIQAVSHILDLDELLERIMDLIFRSIEADRGCVMLREPDSGRLVPKAARWRAGLKRREKITLSHTIMEHVLRQRQGVLVSDAAHDERFRPGQSIVRLGIREAICVPMKGRHETLGVLYLDTRQGPGAGRADQAAGKFTGDHLALAIAIAHQAALAVEDTRYHTALLQAERLAAVGQTIAALSHHIKNILQGLRSGGDILRMGLEDMNEDLLRQGWKIVEKNQGRVYDLVMDMLSYSKEREPALEESDLNQLVRDVLELTQPRARDVAARLESRLDLTLPRVHLDPEGLHRALLNVVSNALEAVEGRKGGHVGVSTSLDPEPGWVRVAVADNGVGIPAEKVEDVFRPFISSKGSRGTGLGLPVSRKILREHGGDLMVQSQAGKGSKFILRLPVKGPFHDPSTGTGEHPRLSDP